MTRRIEVTLLSTFLRIRKCAGQMEAATMGSRSLIVTAVFVFTTQIGQLPAADIGGPAQSNRPHDATPAKESQADLINFVMAGIRNAYASIHSGVLETTEVWTMRASRGTESHRTAAFRDVFDRSKNRSRMNSGLSATVRRMARRHQLVRATLCMGLKHRSRWLPTRGTRRSNAESPSPGPS